MCDKHQIAMFSKECTRNLSKSEFFFCQECDKETTLSTNIIPNNFLHSLEGNDDIRQKSIVDNDHGGFLYKSQHKYEKDLKDKEAVEKIVKESLNKDVEPNKLVKLYKPKNKHMINM